MFGGSVVGLAKGEVGSVKWRHQRASSGEQTLACGGVNVANDPDLVQSRKSIRLFGGGEGCRGYKQGTKPSNGHDFSFKPDYTLCHYIM